MPAEFPLPGGKLSCVTCHDVYKQCKDDPELRQTSDSERVFHGDERRFLRGAPYEKRTGICFHCHDEKQYQPFNPHKQLDMYGEIIVKTCLYCHIEKPDERRSTFKDVSLIGDLQVICQRCHNMFGNHPANVYHYIKPSGKILHRMKRLEIDYAIVLPLDNNGNIFCATCHNPHERGVIPNDRAVSKGASETFRHRLPGKMCKSCHGM